MSQNDSQNMAVAAMGRDSEVDGKQPPVLQVLSRPYGEISARRTLCKTLPLVA